MITLGAVLTAAGAVAPWLVKALDLGRTLASGSASVVAALIGVVPALISAIVQFFRWATETPLNAAAAFGAIFFTVGLFSGWSGAADAIEKAKAEGKREAIVAANKRADVAIERIRNDYAEKLKAQQNRR